MMRAASIRRMRGMSEYAIDIAVATRFLDDQSAPDEGTRKLYEKNLGILQKRLSAYTDIENSLKRIEAQLQSIEYSFGLVNDQIITMPTPEHISTLDLDSLLSSIELTKEILEETAPVLSQLDAAERSSEPGLRPRIAQRQ